MNSEDAPMSAAWTVGGIELPEAFDFPITMIGLMDDVHGGGAFVNTTPTRVECHVHVERVTGQGEGSLSRLEILPSPLHPDRGTELNVGSDFERQFRLSLFFYRGLPFLIARWPRRHSMRVAWSLRGS